MHSCGNDYVYVDCFNKRVDDPKTLAKKLSKRRYSIGSDGLVLILPSDASDAKMRIFNADGSEAETCGNAIRCVGKYLYDIGKKNADSVKVETLAGIKTLTVKSERGTSALVAAQMGKATFKPEKIPVISEGELLLKPYKVGGKAFFITCLSMGNPHAVVTIRSFKGLDVKKIGSTIENGQIFPNKTNVEFVKVIKPDEIAVKVWERGSGETNACGTGACAAAVSCAVNGFSPFNKPITVNMVGGNLYVTVGADLSVTLEGECVKVYEGVVEI